MKNYKLISLLIGVAIILGACSKEEVVLPDSYKNESAASILKATKKPAAKLIGETDLDFTGPTPPVWVGTINFEGDMTEYGMRFYPLGQQKGFSQASPFEEWFEIYDLANPNHVYLAGHDEGVTTLANKPPEPNKYRMNGEIEVAMEPFEGWMGRNVHMSGIITWHNVGTPEEPVIIPLKALGIVRIN